MAETIADLVLNVLLMACAFVGGWGIGVHQKNRRGPYDR